MSAERSVDALLVGGGVASVRCARELRRGGFGGSVLVVGRERLPPYNRPPLSKELMRDEVDEALLHAEPPGWYVRRGVELLTGATVEALDPLARSVTLGDGSRLRYGSLLLATGAEPRRLNVPGGELALVLRTLEDAVRIRDTASPGSSVVIAGGGFIGVELAASLAARGSRVTLLERTGLLWGGRLGPELGGWAAERLATAGVALRFHATVTGMQPGRVALGGDEVISDLVVVAIGVEPRVELARGAGIACDAGIVVDAAQATSAPAVWAAGDVASVEGSASGHWHAARETGARAALGIMGRQAPPLAVPWIFTEVAGASLDIVGDPGAADVTRRIGSASDRFALAYLREGRLVGIASVGGALAVKESRRLIEEGMSGPFAPRRV